jgi:hypothetical protein
MNSIFFLPPHDAGKCGYRKIKIYAIFRSDKWISAWSYGEMDEAEERAEKNIT